MQTTFIKKIRNYGLSALLMLALLMLAPIGVQPTYAAGNIIYAAPGGLTSGACESWANACDLQYALATAVSGDQVWVKAGTYKPDALDRTVSFALKSGVAVYGGFAGTESLRSERDIAANSTILSGDLNGNDNGFTNNGENSYHVVVGNLADNTAVLDGFNIIGGNANGIAPDNAGGGIYNDDGSPILVNLTIRGNSAGFGGGMANFANGNPLLTGVTFNGNSAGRGGGLFNQPGSGSTCADTPDVIIVNSTFSGNSATYGGAIDNENGGVALLFSTITGNLSGGGVNSWNDSSTCTTVGSSIIAGNTGYDVSAADTPTQRFNSLGYNVIGIAGANVDFTKEFNQTGDQTNVVNPKLAPLADNGGPTQTHALLSGSPAFDAGDNTTCAAAPVNSLDQRGVARPQGANCDSGSFEQSCFYPWSDGVTPSLVGNEGELNAAITCFNEINIAGSYTFTLTNDINLTASTVAINNDHSVTGADLTIAGDGHTVNGQDVSGVRPFDVAANSVVTLSQITLTGGNVNYGGGLRNLGFTTIQNSTISANHGGASGGGVYNYGTLVVDSSTISGNQADYGGAVDNEQDMTLSNSTISGNHAQNTGGAITSYGPLTVTNSTFSDNSALFADGINTGAELNLTNSIIANGNTAEDCTISGSGSINASYSLIQDIGTSACSLSNGTNNNIIGQDPKLGPLQDNGGPTQTHALLAGSPAINTGTSTGAPSTDQRGVARPQGSGYDIGAFEVQVQSGPNFVVNTNADTDDGLCGILPDNDCTLREAINAANANAGASEITFADNYTITLEGSQLPDVTTEVTITGKGAANTIVQASACNPVTLPGSCTPATYRVFHVSSTGNLTLDNLTVQYGGLTGLNNGGGVYNQGTLMVTNSTITANAIARYGGGIANETGSTLTVSNSTIIGNAADYGAGIYIRTGTTATITNSTLSGNAAASNGGAIYSQDTMTLTVTDSSFDGNSATGGNGGAILSGGTLILSGSTLSNNSADIGGGIYTEGAETKTIFNSTLSGNSANIGGGIAVTSSGPLTLTNSTLSGNSANTYGGINVYSPGNAALNNSIIANSTSGGDCHHTSGGTITARNSLIEDSLICVTTDKGGNLTGDPSLGTLTGSPAYYPLNSSSIAINAGDNAQAVDASGDPLTTDEAGNVRIQNGTVDIGAYEATITAPTITTQPQSQIIASGQTATLSVVASGSSLSYQWYQGISGDTSILVGTDSDSFTTPALTADTNYWLRVSNPGGNADSDTATVTVEPAPTITFQPQDTTIFSGQTATLTVVADGKGLSYQWYQGASGDTSKPVGSDSDSFTTPALTADTSYWVRVSNLGGSVDSDTALVTINRPPTITSADNTTLTEGAAGSFTVTTAAGVPTSTTISESGALPGGVSFVDNGDGTATLNGTPGIGTFGAYNLSITASNGISPDATQDFTLNILPATVHITVETNPSDLSFTVDGTSYTSSQTFTWTPESSHTLAITSPQAGTPGMQYAFDNWSDGGDLSHSVTAPATDSTYTVTFKTQYELTTAVNPNNGGSISTVSGTYYDANTDVSLTATANSGFTFLSWIGDVEDSSAASTTITMSGPQSVTANFKASTTLLYNGDQIVNIGNSFKAAAKLSSTASACLSGKTIDFSLDINPLDGSAGPYSLGSATTDSDGQATLSVSTSGWQENIYDITAGFAGATDCDPSSDNATLAAAGPGNSATGGGWYTLSGSGRINFGFNVRKVDDKCRTNCAYKGQLLLINNGKWRLKGTLDSYVKTSTGQGAASGTGDLYWWDQSLNGGLGDWSLAQSGVSFTINFYDSNTKGKGQKSGDTFGINIQYVPVPPQPNSLPNSDPQTLKGGDIKVN